MEGGGRGGDRGERREEQVCVPIRSCVFPESGEWRVEGRWAQREWRWERPPPVPWREWRVASRRSDGL